MENIPDMSSAYKEIVSKIKAAEPEMEAFVIFTRKKGQLFASPVIAMDGLDVSKVITLLNEYGSGLKYIAGDMMQKVNKTHN